MNKKVLKFSSIKDDLIKTLRNRELNIEEEVTLINGFFNCPVQTEMTDTFIIGGSTVPMIAVYGNESGRVYWFALKVVLPDLDI